MYDFGEDPDMFMALDPYLLWSRARLENGKADFFESCVGRVRCDGRSQDYEDTNMTQSGQLGTPISYRRKQVIVFPGQPCDYQMWTQMIQRAKIGDATFEMGKIVEYQDSRFYPDGVLLPTPATYARPDYIDTVKQSQPVRDFLQNEKPPCRLIYSDKIINSLDILGTRILADKEFDGFWLYVVYVGVLWCPKPYVELAKAAK
jgi:hypothetical protein